MKNTLDNITIKGTYITYKLEPTDTGYSIGLYNVPDNKDNPTITIVGYSLPNNKKITYSFNGQWITHKKYGKQFVADSFEECINEDRAGIILYLASGVIKGLGLKTAEKIYKKLGNDTLRILDERPEELLTVPGITKKKYESIISQYQENRGARDFIRLVAGSTISPKQAMKYFNVHRTYSTRNVTLNPYTLTEVKGITFFDAEVIAEKMQYPKDSMNRFYCCCEHILKQQMLSGNMGMELNAFGNEIRKIIGVDFNENRINENVITLIKDGALRTKKLDITGVTKQYVFLGYLYDVEHETARDIHRLMGDCDVPYEGDLESFVEEVADMLGITLDIVQRDAVVEALKHNLIVITGAPGTGKTTIIKVLAECYKILYPKNKMEFLAPTGRASKRITEANGFPAKTMHSRLGIHKETEESVRDLQDGEMVDEDYDIYNSLVISDEFSMADSFLSRKLFNCIREGNKVVISGDVDQLPSVGPGAVLRDIIECGWIPVVRLSKVYRQGKDTKIYTNMQKVRMGETDIEEGKDFRIIECASLEEAQEKMLAQYVSEYEQGRKLDDILCLCPVKKGAAGVFCMNSLIQQRINPKETDAIEFVHGDRIFRKNDYVMNLKNDEGVVNGDIGHIITIENETISALMNEHFVEYDSSNIEDLTLAYASTIHKAQGSEAPIVIMCVCNEHAQKRMLNRNVFYTAITRAKECVTIYGNKDAIIQAILNENINRRITSLKYQIQLFCNGIYQ